MHRRTTTKAILALALLMGCGPTLTLTRTGETYPARPADCDFEVLSALPASGYVEIATIDIDTGAVARQEPEDAGELKQAIRPHVCEAGGDAAVGRLGGYGRYVAAIVLKRVEASAPAEPAAAVPAAPAPAGCQYDTQCKGERLCVDGQCVDPPASTGDAAPAPATTGP